MPYRQDDIDSLYDLVGEERKPLQRWSGRFAVVLTDGAKPGDTDLVAQYVQALTESWDITDLSVTGPVVDVTGSYTARGANANDAEKVLANALRATGLAAREVNGRQYHVFTHNVVVLEG
jgi:hypothetical protein